VSGIENFLNGNIRFSEGDFLDNRDYHHQIRQEQKPTLLWIGCADSRVCPTTITNSRLGQIFVHRNIANIVSVDDNSMTAVLEYAIGYLNILDIVVCGHYNCGGIQAVEVGIHSPVISNWLQPAVEILAAVRDDDNLTPTERHQQLVKVNVRLQLTNLSHFSIVRDRAKPLRLHGWVYDLESGKIQVVTSG